MTEKQAKFLEVLFEEAEGDLLKAKRLAGYSENTSVREVVKNLEDEILDLSKKYLATRAPKVAM